MYLLAEARIAANRQARPSVAGRRSSIIITSQEVTTSSAIMGKRSAQRQPLQRERHHPRSSTGRRHGSRRTSRKRRSGISVLNRAVNEFRVRSRKSWRIHWRVNQLRNNIGVLNACRQDECIIMRTNNYRQCNKTIVFVQCANYVNTTCCHQNVRLVVSRTRLGVFGVGVGKEATVSFECCSIIFSCHY